MTFAGNNNQQPADSHIPLAEQRRRMVSEQRRVRDEQKNPPPPGSTAGYYSDTDSALGSDPVEFPAPIGDRMTDVAELRRILDAITSHGSTRSTVASTLNRVRAIDSNILVLIASQMIISDDVRNVSRFQAGCLISEHAPSFLKSECFEWACRFHLMSYKVFSFFLFFDKKTTYDFCEMIGGRGTNSLLS